MPDAKMPDEEQMRRFGFCFDSIPSFSPHHDFHDFYQKAVNACPSGGIIVEIGVWTGRSLCCLGLMAKEANKGLKIYGVDNGVGMGINQNTNPVAKANLTKAGLDGIVTFIEKDSVEAAKMFDDESVWLCFIDGGHLHEIIRDDFIAWNPKVRSDGWIAYHDALMHVCAEPAHAMFGVENIITDNIDIGIIKKRPIRETYDIYSKSYRPEVIPGSWKP